MALSSSSRREKSAARNKPAGAAPRPHGDLPDFRDSHTLAREVAKSIADAANIDAASLAGNGGEGFKIQPNVEVRLDDLSPLRQSTETLEAKLAQGIFGEVERPLVEAELHRRREGHEEHDLSELRQRIAELERTLRNKDAGLRIGQRWIRIFMVIGVVFITVWLVEMAPSLLRILAAT